MPDFIQHIDERLLLWLNSLHTPFLDWLMYWLSHTWIWTPLYLLLIVLIYKNRKFKEGTIIIAIAFALLGLSELLSSGFFKPMVARLRPCHVESLKTQMHFILDSCGGKYGFFSSHASDSFALVTFLFLVFKRHYSLYLLLLWAFMVSVSRVYLGKHYPTDIVAGMLCGMLLGWIGSIVFEKVKAGLNKA